MATRNRDTNAKTRSARPKINTYNVDEIEWFQKNFEDVYSYYLYSYQMEISAQRALMGSQAVPSLEKTLPEDTVMAQLARSLAVRGAANNWPILSKKEFSERMLDLLAH